MIGIELSDWSANATDGTLDGEKFFSCKSGHGYFVDLRHVAQNHTKEKGRQEQYDADLEYARRLQELYERFEGGGHKESKFAQENGNQEEIAVYQSQVYGIPIDQIHQMSKEYDATNMNNGNDKTASECQICLKSFKTTDKRRVLPCLHTFHVTCIAQRENLGYKSCPLCRTSMTTK